MAVALEERDVKADVTAKNRYVAVVHNKERNVKRNFTAKNRYTVVARGTSKQNRRHSSYSRFCRVVDTSIEGLRLKS